MSDQKNDKNKTAKTKKWTTVFVWIMIFSIVGSALISVIYTLLSLN